jgi:hypothetical protein
MVLLGACASQSSIKPTEQLDERSGITVASLPEPIEFVASKPTEIGKRASFAYLGPIEWNRMGDIQSGLWVHLAPGNNQQFANIHDIAAVTLTLDDRAIVLAPMEAPALGREPYSPVVSWGQTAYFKFGADDLKHWAASSTSTLQFRGPDGAAIEFQPSRESRASLAAYLQSRHISGD